MAASTATEHIHAEVRELIRRRGIDPVIDHRSTRSLIDEVIAHYEERVPMSVAAAAAGPGGRCPACLRHAGRIRPAATLPGRSRLSRKSGSISPVGSSSPATAAPS